MNLLRRREDVVEYLTAFNGFKLNLYADLGKTVRAFIHLIYIDIRTTSATASIKWFKKISFLFFPCFANQIIIPCCLAVLVALVAGEATQAAAAEDKQDINKNVDDQTADGTVKTKRGLHSLGDYGWHGSYGEHGGYGGWHGGHDDHHYGGSEHHEHHEHIKTITIEKKIPVPYTVHKHIPYTVEKKV